MRRFIWISLIAVFLLIIVGAIVANLWINSYLRSTSFRNLIEKKTGLALNMQATYDPFQWSGLSVYSDEFSGVAETSDITAQRIRANFNLRALLDGSWRVEDLNIGRLDATFGTPHSSAALLTSKHATSMPSPTPEAPSKPSTLESMLPSRFEMGEVVISDGNLSWGTGRAGTGNVAGTAFTITPESKGWNIAAKGGILTLKDFPALTIQTAKLRAQRGTLYITNSSLTTRDGGTVTASGERAEDGALQLKIDWNKIPAQSLLQEPWNKRLTGMVQGTANLKTAPNDPLSLAGNFLLTDGLLQGVPMQNQIATFTQQPQYSRLPIQQFSGKYMIQAGKIALTELVLESKGLLRIEGLCLIEEDGALQGRLRVGVTPQSLQWLPGSRERVFTTSENGYFWTDVLLSGTLQNPRENLSSRLIAAAAGQVIDSGINAGKGLIEHPVESTEGTVKDAIDVLKPILPIKLP